MLHPRPEDPDLVLASVGDVIGPYRITAPLRHGGMSECYHAEPDHGGAPVVLKLASRRAPSCVDALVREAAALSRLRHRSIVASEGTVEGTRVFGLALARVEGEELAERLANGDELPVEAVVSWVEDLAAALDHVHEAGLLHGDVKPSNVLIVEDGSRWGRAVLIDFGLSRGAGAQIGGGSGRTLMGTPHYMAPEQVIGRTADIGPAADRYALAALALEALTGHRPYAQASTGHLLRAILDEPPRAPSDLGLVGDDIDALFARALARNPRERFETAADFAHALRAIMRDVQTAPRRDGAQATAPTVASHRPIDWAA